MYLFWYLSFSLPSCRIIVLFLSSVFIFCFQPSVSLTRPLQSSFFIDIPVRVLFFAVICITSYIFLCLCVFYFPYFIVLFPLYTFLFRPPPVVFLPYFSLAVFFVLLKRMCNFCSILLTLNKLRSITDEVYQDTIIASWKL